jgi:hypothetical protein
MINGAGWLPGQPQVPVDHERAAKIGVHGVVLTGPATDGVRL